MRKLAAILLICLLLFNFIGYKLFYGYLSKVENEKITLQIDQEEYDDSDLIEVKIPINLPYQNNWITFERYDGEISVDGKEYKYVKRKIENDTLTILCLPFDQHDKLKSNQLGYLKSTNDIAGTSTDQGKKSTEIFKLFNPDYKSDQNEFFSYRNIVTINKFQLFESNHLQKGFRFSEERPPCS